MKKALVTLACLFVLCALITSNPRILEIKPVLAGANDLRVQSPIVILGNATSDPAGLSPTDIRKVYNLPSTGGNGTIAIIEPYDDPTILNDLRYFSTYFGLPFNDANFKKHMMAQSINSSAYYSDETSLDVEWAHAIAPNATILLVEAVSDTIGDVFDAVDYARNQPDVVAISISYGVNETDIKPYVESYFDTILTGSPGVSFFASAGDNAENVTYPACSPNVVAVGGTRLNFVNGSFASEVVWNDSSGVTGGGVSAYETEPSYQVSYGVQGSNGHRAVPDVSFDASGYSGVSIYDSTPYKGQSGWLVSGGTSLGPPCWAAIHSLKPTALNPRLYAIAKSVYNSSSLRDITVGTNGKYNATSGYDFCTGLGSPLTSAFVGGLGDINLDATVDVFDAILLENAFNSVFGSVKWNSAADLNNDGIVDIYDALILAGHFGHNYTVGSKSGTSGTPTEPGTLSGGASVLVDPSQITVFKGEVFTVNVDVTSVTDLRGWEFKLYWNSTVLNCTNVAVQTPTEWQNSTQNYGPGLEPNYNATHACYWQAQAVAYPASSFNGSMTMVTLTFQALQPGTTPLTLTDVKLGNSTAEPIACSVSSGSVTVYYGRYMRSDTQTINGLNAYVLNIPESTSSASFTQSGSGAGAWWGIRAWVRHSNGVEQEISLDGQTGTPKAIVGGGMAGTKSSTVSAAQTALQPTDSLVVRVYVQIGGGPWNLCATFTTEQLHAGTLNAATWTVYCYTYSRYLRVYDWTTATFYWGTTTYGSRIQNLQYG